MTMRFDMVRFSVTVKVKRELCDLSLRELAEICSISYPTLSRIERGEGAPDIATFAVLCGWLNMSPNQFFKEVKNGEQSGIT